MKRLSKEQILMIHSQLIEQTGRTAGVRDFNLLESAIETPRFRYLTEKSYIQRFKQKVHVGAIV